MNTFDTIVIGGGLTGLLLTRQLHQAGRRVALLEATENLGGRYRRSQANQPFAAPGLNFIPASEGNLNVLEQLKSIAPLPFHFEVREHRPQIFSDGAWRPFAGFGQTEFASLTQLSLFGQAFEAHLEPGLEQVARSLIEQLPIAANTSSVVTGLKMEGHRITSVVVNADKQLHGHSFIFTPHPTQLNNLIEGGALTDKSRSRLAKMETWTVVTLALEHKTPLTEVSDVHVFTSGQKDFEPVVGRISGLRSKWITLVQGEREAEHEFTGQCLRHIKRQIKRAWPQAFDELTEERIFVQNNAMGLHSLRNKESFRLPEINNLYLANHCLATLDSDLGSAQTAFQLESNLVGTLQPQNYPSTK